MSSGGGGYVGPPSPGVCVMFPCNYIILVTCGHNNLNTTWNICGLPTVTAVRLCSHYNPSCSSALTDITWLVTGNTLYHLHHHHHVIITIMISNSWCTSHCIKRDNLYISQTFGELRLHHGLSRPGTDYNYNSEQKQEEQEAYSIDKVEQWFFKIKFKFRYKSDISSRGLEDVGTFESCLEWHDLLNNWIIRDQQFLWGNLAGMFLRSYCLIISWPDTMWQCDTGTQWRHGE